MSEGIPLPPLPRGTLLPVEARVARLVEAVPLIESALDGEDDEVAALSTLACLLWHTLPQANWCGFYRVIAPELLAVGPYQGGMGCVRIPFAKGMCGRAARTRRRVLVADVRVEVEHIACNDATLSELVLPYEHDGAVRGVLDLDSPHLDAFSVAEAELLEGLLLVALRAVRFGG